MVSILLLGAGGHGKVVGEIAESLGIYSEIAFLDDAVAETSNSTHHPYPILGPFAAFSDLSIRQRFTHALVSVGNTKTRLSLTAELTQNGFIIPTLVHPTAYVSPSTSIGPGTTVMPLTIVNSGSSVAQCCILNSASVVEHNCTLHEGVHLCPGSLLAGDVTVHRRTWIGLGARVNNGITIGSDTIVGAGAVVITDLPNNVTAVGIPAKALPAI